MREVFANATVVIILYVSVLNQCSVYLKCTQSYVSIISQEEKEETTPAILPSLLHLRYSLSWIMHVIAPSFINILLPLLSHQVPTVSLLYWTNFCKELFLCTVSNWSFLSLSWTQSIRLSSPHSIETSLIRVIGGLQWSLNYSGQVSDLMSYG